MENPVKLYKIRFYDCKDYEDRMKAQDLLKKCGARVQDFRYKFKYDEVEFEYTLECGFTLFVNRLKASPLWASSTYAEIYTGSL